MTAQAVYDRQQRFDRRYGIMENANKMRPMVLRDLSPMPQNECNEFYKESWRSFLRLVNRKTPPGILAEIAELTSNVD